MNPQSNAAQENIWETATSFHAVQLEGTWTMQAGVHVEDDDDYVVSVVDTDYNKALVELANQLH
jgi:hypothetical protein